MFQLSGLYCNSIIIVYGWLSKLGVPFLGTLNIRCRIMLRTQKGTVILITTHIWTLWFKDLL